MTDSRLNRRSLIKAVGLGAAAFALSNFAIPEGLLAQSNIEDIEEYVPKGKVKQSVSKWCFGGIPMDKFIPICKKLGMVGIDLVDPKDWKLLLENEMIVTMGNVPGSGIGFGFNKEKNHDKLIETFEKHIPMAAELKVPNLICFSGNREGQADEEGIEMCVKGLKKLMPLAEKHKVTLVMELLNSRGHKDYAADHTKWGATVARNLGSERFKLLYDIYHMQIMEGNIIDTINEFKDTIGHYHTGGNPGRQDIDESQEIYYPAVIRAIMKTGYDGFLAHEFLPKNGIKSLRRGIEICDV